MPRSTREKSPTGICHVMLGQESKTCPSDSLKDKPINLNNAVAKWGRKSQHWGSQYGLYKIEKDTINVTVYGRYEGHYNIYKYKFKILDADNILLCKYERPSLNPKESYSSQMHPKF